MVVRTGILRGGQQAAVGSPGGLSGALLDVQRLEAERDKLQQEVLEPIIPFFEEIGPPWTTRVGIPSRAARARSISESWGSMSWLIDAEIAPGAAMSVARSSRPNRASPAAARKTRFTPRPLHRS